MPKKRERVTPSKGRTRDPMQDQTPTGRKRAGKVKKGKGSASSTDRAQCTAHKRNGDRCSNPPVRGAKVCRMHGGSAPQVKAKANQRLIEMILPALAHLRKIIDSPATSDADKLKAIGMVLNRTGYSERHSIDLGLRESTAFDDLTRDAFTIRRGADLADELSRTAIPELPHPNDATGVDDDALDGLLDERERRREREAETHINNSGHEVVEGRVQQPAIRAEEREREAYDRTRTEMEGERRPDEDPWTEYERRVRERQEGR